METYTHYAFFYKNLSAGKGTKRETECTGRGAEFDEVSSMEQLFVGINTGTYKLRNTSRTLASVPHVRNYPSSWTHTPQRTLS
jgi:hypothetical protein